MYPCTPIAFIQTKITETKDFVSPLCLSITLMCSTDSCGEQLMTSPCSVFQCLCLFMSNLSSKELKVQEKRKVHIALLILIATIILIESLFPAPVTVSCYQCYSIQLYLQGNILQWPSSNHLKTS